jgi:hypothetical protein
MINENKKMTMLPPRNPIGQKKKDEEQPKLRVAANCRVSTDSVDQPVCPEHFGLSEIHPAAEGQEHPGHF